MIPALVGLMSSLSLEVGDSSPALISLYFHPNNTKGVKSNLRIGKNDRFHPTLCVCVCVRETERERKSVVASGVEISVSFMSS